VLVPLITACITSAVLVNVPTMLDAPLAVRWGLVLAMSTVALVVSHGALSRLLPLAALLELSIQFPGPAPTRLEVAKDAGNTRKLQEVVTRAQRGDPLVDMADAAAARDIISLVAALSMHDAATRGHSDRVRTYTDLIANQMGLHGADREHLRWAALLHDVGKLAISAGVLNKTGKLTEEDWTQIRRHPAAGAHMASPLRSWLGSWAATIAQHHERYDGAGYPRGLKGDEINLGARIVAVADAFDVMTASRSYRKPMSRDAALRELASCSGSQFYPRVVRAMLSVSTPRLRWAMGPLSWLGASPFLAASQGALAVASQASAGALVAGTVIMAGPAAAALPGTTAATSPTPTQTSWGHHHVTTGSSSTPQQSTSRTSPTTRATPTATPSAAPTHTPKPKQTPPGNPSPSPTKTKPTRAPTPTPAPSPSKTGHGNGGGGKGGGNGHGKPTPTPTP